MLRTKNRYVVRVSKTQRGAIISKCCIFCIYVVVFSTIYLMFFPFLRQAYDTLDLGKDSEQSSPRKKYYEEENYLIDNIDLDCEDIKAFNFSRNATKTQKYITWKFDMESVMKSILESPRRCDTIKSLFPFASVPKSNEEKNYPLAYGILVYYNFVQFLFMLSSIYEPQNHYCVAVSGSATKEFKMLTQLTSDCFHNVHVLLRPRISWGSFEIINSTYTCMETLTRQAHWEYFQYLSGVDAPLKTNLEMVGIFKQLNGSANLEFLKFPKSRLKGKKMENSPIPILKSSLSALVPRKAAEYMVQSNVTRSLLKFLKGTSIPDESFWGTVFGNPDVFPVPGAINGSQFLLEQSKVKEQLKKKKSPPTRSSYYLSRYQVWKKTKFCKGKLSSGSCVYGVQDLNNLIARPHLIAHKFYTNFQPAGYFCVLKEIRQRSRNGEKAFDDFAYNETPLVELNLGRNYTDLTNQQQIKS